MSAGAVSWMIKLGLPMVLVTKSEGFPISLSFFLFYFSFPPVSICYSKFTWSLFSHFIFLFERFKFYLLFLFFIKIVLLLFVWNLFFMLHVFMITMKMLLFLMILFRLKKIFIIFHLLYTFLISNQKLINIIIFRYQ